jgi:hypothetical protein
MCLLTSILLMRGFKLGEGRLGVTLGGMGAGHGSVMWRQCLRASSHHSAFS